MPVREDLRAKFAVYNPHDQPTHTLPVIYGFNNGGSIGFMSGSLIAEDGTPLGGHLCSSEGFMYGDLGILEGYRSDRHEDFQKHYPDGYRMDFVPYEDFDSHAGLQAAFAKYDAAHPDEAKTVPDDRSHADVKAEVR